jgi:membrane peptidoglycan carboxypeptidase
LLQLDSAYATFANNGVRNPERAILQITDPLGQQVTDANGKPFYPYVPNPQGYQAISPQAAYQVTSILTDNSARVGDFGQSNPLHFPGREVAGKTGTSQNVEDIVTMGYVPSIAIGVWVGNADKSNTPLAQNIIGIAGAAYIFNAVMAFALDKYHIPGTAPSYGAPTQAGGSFPIPPDMHRAVLSCTTGLAPYAGAPKECDPTSQKIPAAMAGDFAGGKVHSYGWGSKDTGNNFQMPGTNIAWLPNGEDPVSP